MIQGESLHQIRRVRLPRKRILYSPAAGMRLTLVERDEIEIDAKVMIYRSSASNPHRFIIESSDFGKIIVETKSVPNDYDDVSEIWRCSELRIEGACLVMIDPIDRNPTEGCLSSSDAATEATRSWSAGLKYVKEELDENGEVKTKGLREPQYASLHALANYWASNASPATIVLPTGTGKTDVMIGAIVANQCQRTLIIVPTDALRAQTVEKFETYGVLRRISAVDDSVKYPVIGCINGAPTQEMIDNLTNCNIVVTTMASLAKAGEAVRRSFAGHFSHVFFDEAHHRAAKTWDEFYQLCGRAKILLMTATPFREDGKPIGGKFIYSFPLHKAQEQGYFRPIHFKEVFEPNEQIADLVIAEAAVSCLQEDISNGLDHIMMARTKTIDDARRLYEQIYLPKYQDLNPVLIHSQSRGKAKVLSDIKRGIHKIVICVEMLGEGFDLPQLKIAALHSVHKSIGITLQFVGRFTRSSIDNVGDATFVANLAEDGMPESLEALYQEDADWNVVVSELSYDAISPQAKLSALVEGLIELDAEEGVSITPLTLKPKINSNAYRTDRFLPRNYRRGFSEKNQIVRSWLGDGGSLLIVITRTKDGVEWSDTKDIELDEWDLHLAYHNPDLGLLFTNSSRKGGFPKRAVESISNAPALISGEDVFRAFSGLHRLTLFSVGLTGRSKNVRYRMFAGMDVKEAITPIEEGDKLKSLVSGVGYEEGGRVNVGCSRKGKVWSMMSGSVSEWKDWCDHIGAKLINDHIQPRDFLKYTLIPEAIVRLPDESDAIGLMVDWPEAIFQSQMFSTEVEADGNTYSFDSVDLILSEWSNTDNAFEFCLYADNKIVAQLRLSLLANHHNGERYLVSKISEGIAYIISSGRNIPIEEYFQENPPLVRLSDGSQLSGNILLKPREELGDTYDRDWIDQFDWSGATITRESRWKDGMVREDSVQQVYMLHLARNERITHLIDDDDSGESADIVAIEEDGDQIVVYLLHCKYSSGDSPGHRANDLYEVCGQAQKSAKWTWSFDRLVKHIKKRETETTGGRSTRFMKGSYFSLHTLRKAAKRKQISYRIGIVQPGLEKANMPSEHLALLGATNAFVTCITNQRLLVVAS